MSDVKSLAQWMAVRGVSLPELVKASALDERVVTAIAEGRYTSSPDQRRRLAAALDVSPELVDWGHAVEVQHLYGHGAQFGRSP